MKWVIWFILACIGLVAIVLLALWAAGQLDALGRNPNIAVAAGLGILFSTALGAGLMALIFYSNRSGVDESTWSAQRDRKDIDDRR